MPVHDLYSKRRKKELGRLTDVYRYDMIPRALRVQVTQIWGDAIGTPSEAKWQRAFKANDDGVYFDIVKILRREYALLSLFGKSVSTSETEAREELVTWFLHQKNANKALDAIEISFRFIENGRLNRNTSKEGARRIARAAVEELNARFREHGVGYQYEDGLIIRVDSQQIHTEAVVPALGLLRRPGFANAEAEFLGAFEHYRQGKHQQALIDCCKCFESTMKVICARRGWAFDPNRTTATELVKICFDNGLIPAYWASHFAGLRSVLTSSITTPRNRQAGHGAGTATDPMPPAALVSYVLHMTASTVLFLAESDNQLP